MRLYQRGKRKIWWADFKVAGRPRFTRSSGTTDRRKAEEWAATAQASEWRQEKLGEQPEYTWAQAVADWLTKHGHERRSIETMKDRLRWITKRLEHVPLSAITRTRVELLMDEKRTEGVTGRSKSAAHPRPVAPKTLNNYVCEIAKILNHACVLGWITAVPPLRHYAVPKPPVTWLTFEEADKLLDELPQHLAAMARFALATGLRESNVRLLRWKQVDVLHRLAWVEAQDAKANKPIAVPLNQDAIDVLMDQTGRHDDWVFPYEGAPVSNCSNSAWYAAIKRAGVPNFRWHDLRHTWASWHVQAGTPLPVLQQLGGWASLTMVQRYAHLGRDHTAVYADRIVRDNRATTSKARLKSRA
jgi:integrase